MWEGCLSHAWAEDSVWKGAMCLSEDEVNWPQGEMGQLKEAGREILRVVSLVEIMLLSGTHLGLATWKPPIPAVCWNQGKKIWSEDCSLLSLVISAFPEKPEGVLACLTWRMWQLYLQERGGGAGEARKYLKLAMGINNLPQKRIRKGYLY